MDVVEVFGLFLGQADAALGDDAQARLLDHRIDLAGQVALGRVGFQNREGAFGHGEEITRKRLEKSGWRLIATRARFAKAA